ncbi:hypothetical protein [Nocardia sp. NPDC004123]
MGLEAQRSGRRSGENAKLPASQAEALTDALIVFTPEQFEVGGL